MSHHDAAHTFHYQNVLGRQTPAIFKKDTALGIGLDKPDGFRIPLIYFSWGVLEGSRDAHHHPDNDELLLVLSGEATIGLIGPGRPGARFEETYEVSAGDVVLFPQGWVHYLEDKACDGEDPVKVLVVFNNQDFKAVEVETLRKRKMCMGENA